MPVSSPLPLPLSTLLPAMSDQIAALRFAVGLPQQVCEEALARCQGDTIKAEQLLRVQRSRLVTVPALSIA